MPSGHLRIATNTSWTLNTGYLVLFMQAGFALLTCGLVRKKNAAHLMMLNFAAYVFAFLAYYAVGFAFQWGGVAINAAPAAIGGTPTLNEYLIGSGQWGFLGGKGFFLSGPGVRRQREHADALRSRLHGDGRLHHRRRDLRAHHLRRIHPLRALRRRHPLSDLRLLGVGRRVDVAARLDDGARPRLRRLRRLDRGARGRRILRHGAGGRFSVRASANTVADGKPRAFPAHNIPFVVTGTFILLFGWMGFNPGSTLGGDRSAHLRRSR